jgi:hypothetical protein
LFSSTSTTSTTRWVHCAQAAVARTPEDKKIRKARFIELLAEGCSPGVAARGAGIDRSTAYIWKNEDKEFSAKWVDAVETGLDELETAVYKRGLKEGGQAAWVLA